MLPCFIYLQASNKNILLRKVARYIIYIAFIDASKAFDKVLHNGLFVKLLKKNVSVKFVRILHN